MYYENQVILWNTESPTLLRKIPREQDRRGVEWIFKRDRHTTIPQTLADLNADASTIVIVRIIQQTIIDIDFQSRRPTHVPLLTVGKLTTTKLYALAGSRWYRHRVTEAGLMNFISNCIRRMDAYEYGDNFMNPSTLYINRGMFNLWDYLWW